MSVCEQNHGYSALPQFSSQDAAQYVIKL